MDAQPTPSPSGSSGLLQKSLNALAWSYGGALARALAQLVIQLALARLLGPAAFGQATAVFVVLGLSWLMAEGGFGAALVQKADLSEADIGHAFTCVLVVSGLTGLAVAAAAQHIAHWQGDATLQPMLQVCGLLIPLQALSNLPASLLKRSLDMRQVQIIQLLGYLLAYGGLGITLALQGAGAWSLVAAFGLQVVLVGLASQWVLHKTQPMRWRLQWRGDPALRRFGYQITGTNLVNWAIENVDRLLVGRYWGATALGEYAAAANLSRAPASMLVSSAQAVTFASASRVQDDLTSLRLGYLATLRLAGLLTWPLFVWLGWQATAVVSLLYGHRWDGAAPLFAAFCAAVPLYALLCLSGPLLWAVGAVSAELKAQLWSLAATVAGFLLCLGLPLAQVAWLVPGLYALRLLLVVLPLASRLALTRADAVQALAPGALMGGMAALACLAAQQTAGQGLSAAALSLLLWVAGFGGLILLGPRWWLGQTLVTLLRARGGERLRRWLPVGQRA